VRAAARIAAAPELTRRAPSRATSRRRLYFEAARDDAGAAVMPHEHGGGGGGGGSARHGGGTNLQNFYHGTMHAALLLACAAEAAERRSGAGSSGAGRNLGVVPRGTGLAALAAALGVVVALMAIHTALQPPAEALRHALLCAPLALAAAAAAADVAAPRRGALLARSYGLALAGAWMAHMAVARRAGWDAPYDEVAGAAQTVATLHFTWYALLLLTAWGVAVCAARARALGRGWRGAWAGGGAAAAPGGGRVAAERADGRGGAAGEEHALTRLVA
jgi:hypothetical protein